MRRWALRICVCLILGAIVNVAVAWGCVCRSHLADPMTSVDNVLFVRHQPLSTLDFEPGVVRIWQTSHAMSVFWIQPTEFLDDDEFRTRLPSWSVLKRADLPECATKYFGSDLVASNMVETGAGFPALSLCGANARTDFAWPEHRVFLLELPFGSDYPEQPIVVPFRPIWPGFAINTVFYAVVLWLLFSGAFALRRRRRIKRGLCPKCAYDLRNRPSGLSVCPECGTTVTSLLQLRRMIA